jgi:hypothetical protein
MKVIYEGKSYAASDSNNQESFPVPGFNLMQKGLLHIFIELGRTLARRR